MDIHLTQTPCTRVDERVRCTGWNDDDLPRMPLPRLIAHREGRHPFLKDEDLLIGMLMQAWAFAGRGIHHDERDIRPT